MGVRRTQHAAEGHAGQDDVADTAAAAPEQTRILEPGYALADRKFTHDVSLSLSSAERRRSSASKVGVSVRRYDVGVFGELHRRGDVVPEEPLEFVDAHGLPLDAELCQ